GDGGAGNIAWVLARMVLYLALALAFGLLALPRLIRWVRALPISQGVLSFSVIVMLLYAVSAELLGGMAGITGAFLAGLMFARSPEREALEPRVGALAYGFFVPIFFVDIGLEADLRVIGGALGLTTVIVVVAVVGKLLGAGLGARLSGLSWRESAQLGTGMVSRGEVGLIVAAVGAEAGLLSDAAFSAIVGMVVLTTLITPMMLRALFRTERAPGAGWLAGAWMARFGGLVLRGRQPQTPKPAGDLPARPGEHPTPVSPIQSDAAEEEVP
ncbi:MAG: cation:proton antiporter, partial [Anaerolineales bacterium]